MTYQNKWTFQGFTQQPSDSYKTYGYLYGPPPDSQDPWPAQQVIDATTTTILANVQPKLATELAKGGITLLNVSKIEPQVTVAVTSETNLFFTHFPDVILPTPAKIWHHSLSITATVYFETDQPLIQSPIAPWLIAGLIELIQYIILVAAVALVVYAIAETFIKSFFTQTQTVETYNPQTGQWTKETVTTPSQSGQIVTVIAVLGGLAIVGYFALQYLGKRKRGR